LSIEDYGGGQFYGMGQNEIGVQHPDYRIARIEGQNTAPCHFYSCNQEISKGDSGTVQVDWGEVDCGYECINTKNVRFYVNKREGDSTSLIVNNSQNVAFYGECVMADWRQTYQKVTGTSNNVVLAMSVMRSVGDGSNPYNVVEETLDGQTPVSLPIPHNLAIYKRGELDYDAMWA
jgi:hypothetical protein